MKCSVSSCFIYDTPATRKVTSRKQDTLYGLFDPERHSIVLSGGFYWKLVVEDWLTRLIQSMYENARSRVRVSRRLKKDFSVKVGVHQGSCLSPALSYTLRFITVLKAPSQEFRTGCPWKKYEFDLVYRIWDAVGTASEADSLEV